MPTLSASFQYMYTSMNDNFKFKEYEMCIRDSYKGRLQQTTEFEDIVIKALPDGNVLRLGDVADIELGRLAYTFNNMVNGHKAVSDVYKRQRY